MAGSVVILVRQAGLGVVNAADAAFGVAMFGKFLHALEAQRTRPQAICFYTEGVKLICEGSPVLEALRLLQGMGVKLVACGTCLDYYGLRDKAAVGEIGTMTGIATLLAEARRTITV